MKAIVEIEEIDSERIKINSYYVGEEGFSLESLSHKEIKNLMEVIKDYYRAKGYKDEEIKP